jgi:uncharacterized membrane protein YoaK (UPF0700 family)
MACHVDSAELHQALSEYQDSTVMSDSGTQKSDAAYYIAAVLLGLAAGWVSVQVGDLLFTAFMVLAPCMLLGGLRPQRPWRWVVVIGALVPIVQLAAHLLTTRKSSRAEVWESFLAWLPGIAGAYGGALLRGAIDNILGGK